MKYNAEKIKENVSIVELVQSYGIEIKNNKIKCPFHADNDPSMQLYPNKKTEEDNDFFCFGCHKRGDTIEFVKLMENTDFNGACEKLVQNFNIVGATSDTKQNAINFIELGKVNHLLKDWSEKAYKILSVYVQHTTDDNGKAEVTEWLDILLKGSVKAKQNFYIEHSKKKDITIWLEFLPKDIDTVTEFEKIQIPEHFEPIHINETDISFYSKFKKIQKETNGFYAPVSADERPLQEEPTEITAENILNPDTYNYIYSLNSEIDVNAYILNIRQKAKEYRLIKEFDTLIQSIRKQAIKEIKERNKQEKLNRAYEKQKENREKYKIPDWILYDNWNNPYINETAYINDYSSKDELKCINGKMYSIEGIIDDRKLEHDIQECISPYIIKNIAQLTKRLTTALKNKCYSPPIRFNRNEIHVNNGLLMIDGTFIPEKRFCINRLNISYEPTAGQPTKWLNFLNDLLYDEDIISLQEYLGYCLIPTTKSQVMMFIIGNGGEGKSVIGEVLQEIFKQNMVNGKLNTLQTDKFFTANLESKLLFLDDDINMQALPDTGKLKEIVTNPYHTIERKGVQGYDAELCARLLCFGNGAINSLYDKTDGFYRRQIILKTKPKDKNRKDNLLLKDEIVSDELQGIFNWMFAGLQRLIEHNFNIYVSDRAKQNLKEAQEDNFNFITFLNDKSECQYGAEYEATTKEIFEEYEAWCYRNAYEPFKKNTISKHLANNAIALNIKSKRYVKTDNNKYSRGYEGIKIIKNRY